MMFTSPQRLDIRLPQHWNQCSAEELELIANVIREETERTNSFHPFSMTDVKVALFFVLGHVTIVEPLNPRVKVEDQYYVCEHPDIDGRFHLYLWQIDYWVCGMPDFDRIAQMEANGASKEAIAAVPKKTRGKLDWIDDDKDFGLTNMPYEYLRVPKHYDDWRRFTPIGMFHTKMFRGPQALMQNFSWQQYRFAGDFMDNYIQQENQLARMMQHRTKFSPTDFIKQYKNVDIAKAMFLATIFDAKVKYIDVETHKAVTDYHYTSNQHSDNAQYFRDFPDEKWQVVLFWWSGMMRYLQNKYPHVFKKSAVKENKRNNPLEVYTATIATLEKYLKQTEEELNRKTFVLTLETLERMARENEEMERIRKK